MNKPQNNPDGKPKKITPTRPYPRLQTEVKGESKTKQSFASETDINVIMAKYQKTGEMPVLNSQKPNYGYAPSYDFREALELVDNMTSNFDKLPSKIRQQFNYNPEEFLSFVEDPVNAAELQEMGLLEKPPTPTPTPTVPDAKAATEEPTKEPPAPTPDKSENGS